VEQVNKEFFAQAAAEVANGFIDEALYLKSLCLCDSNDAQVRSLYIRLRAEELHIERKKEERLNSAARVLGGAAGIAVGAAQFSTQLLQMFAWRRALFSICSLIIPGSGHYFSGRGETGFKFFSVWIWTMVAQVMGMILFGQYADITTYGSPLVTKAALIIWLICFNLVLFALPIWSAVDNYISFNKPRPNKRANTERTEK
jgi:hypothetical protein